MPEHDIGHITARLAGTVDTAQVVLVFFIGFVLALFLYLRREDKREGYPLVDPAGGRDLVGFPPVPPPKHYKRMHGDIATIPHPEGRTGLALEPLFRFPGAPFTPTGDAMRDGVGPASWAMKEDRPLLTWEGHPQLQPLRKLPGWVVDREDTDPRGMIVLDNEGAPVGTVTDLWLDHGVKILRYLEVTLAVPGGPPRALIPVYFVRTRAKAREVRVPALSARQFATFPQLQASDQITAREEDQVASYCQGGLFYGRPGRFGAFR